MSMSLQCTLFRRGQPEDRSLPVQVWALTHCVLAYLLCCSSLFAFYFVLFFSAFCIAYYFVCGYLVLFVSLLRFCMNAVICRLFNPFRCGHSCFIMSHFRDHYCQGLSVSVAHKYFKIKYINEYIDKLDGCMRIARESHSNSIGDIVFYMNLKNADEGTVLVWL